MSWRGFMRKARKSAWPVFLGIFLVGLPLLLLCIYNQPSADDYCLYNRLQKEGWLGLNVNLYMAWTGRYFSSALFSSFYSLVSLYRDNWSVPFKAFPVVAMVSFYLALAYALRTWTADFLKKSQSLAGSCVIFTLFAAQMPSLYEGVYWPAGVTTYLFSLTWLLLLIGGTKRLVTDQESLSQRRTILLTCGLGMLSAAAVGSNETVVAATVSWLALLLFAKRRARNKRKPLIVLLILALSCTAVVVLAPGNFVRLDYLESYGIGRAILETGHLLLRNVKHWLSPMLLIATLYLVAFFLKSKVNIAVRKWPHPIVILSIVGLILFGMTFPSVWAYHGGVPVRVLNTIYLVFILAWSITAYSVTSFVRARYGQLGKRLSEILSSNHGYTILIVLYLLAVIFSPNMALVWRDLITGKAETFNVLSEQRRQTVEQMRLDGATDVTLTPILELPTSITSSDLSQDPGDWINMCYAERFGLKTVRTSTLKIHP